MYKIILFLVLLLSGSCVFAPQLSAQSGTALPDAPASYTPINDFADMLTDYAEVPLHNRLVDYEAQTSNQFVIVTLDSLDGRAIASVAIELAEKWGIGQKGNNGLLILLAEKEREVRIEVGYGLEQDITDLQSSRIIEQQMVPAFKRGNYMNGLSKAVSKLMQLAARDFKREKATSQIKEDSENKMPAIAHLILLFLALGAAVFVARSPKFPSVSIFPLLLVVSVQAGHIVSDLGYSHTALPYLIFAAITALIGLIWFSQENKKQRKKAARQDYEKTLEEFQQWIEEQSPFQPAPIHAKVEQLRKRIEPVDQARYYEDATRKLRAWRNIPDQYFSRRSDTDLLKLKPAVENMLDVLQDPHKEQLAQYWEERKKYWEGKSHRDLFDSEKAAFQEDVLFFKRSSEAVIRSAYAQADRKLRTPNGLDAITQRFYNADAIQAKKEALEKQLAELHFIQDFEQFDPLLQDILDFYEHPERLFDQRIPYALQDIRDDERLWKIVNSNWYDKAERRKIKDFLQQELDYFEQLPDEMPSAEDRERLTNTLQRLHTIRDHPAEELGYDGPWLWESAQSSWEKWDWKALEEKFTKRSIRQVRHKLQDLHRAAQDSGAPEDKARFFFGLRQLRLSPATALEKKQTRHYSSSTSRSRKKESTKPFSFFSSSTAEEKEERQVKKRRSSSSQSSSSHKRSSSSSSSSSSSRGSKKRQSKSDWGGGSFGGGGASGSW